jgi:hypothetical protein|uniref:Uncharacterized protein n=1 Tax=viral metagenome TaxID=1070528 RepID=A0A6C0BWY5_9ZZZZ
MQSFRPGKSANNAVNAWKAKMRPVVSEIKQHSGLRENIHGFRISPVITVKLMRLGLYVYNPSLSWWIRAFSCPDYCADIGLHPLLIHTDQQKINHYYTGSERAIGSG